MWVEFVTGSLPCSKRFFFAYSGFPLSSKNQHFQIPIQSGMHWHISMSSQELLSASRVNKLHFFLLQFYNLQYPGNSISVKSSSGCNLTFVLIIYSKKINLWSFGICYLEKLDVKQSLGYLENMALDWSTLWEDI